MTRAELETVVGIQEVREMLSRGRARLIAKSYAEKVTRWPGFPAPIVVYPHPVTGRRAQTRLWLVAEVEDWMRRTQPAWRDLPPPPDA